MDKKKALELYLKRAQSGQMELDPFISRTGDLASDIYRGRDFQEEAMGKLALEQFKGKVPGAKASEAQVQDLLEGLRDQFLPDVDSEIRTNPLLESLGIYTPKDDVIEVNPLKRNASQTTGDFIHEGLHSRDLKWGDYGDINNIKSGPQTNKALAKLNPDMVDSMGRILDPKKAKELIKTTDLNDLKELLLEGHHGLKRGGTVGNVNLQRLLKGLPLKSIAGVAAGGLSVAAEAADTEDVGGSTEQAALLREVDAQNQMKQIDEADIPKDIKLKALELFKKNKLPY